MKKFCCEGGGDGAREIVFYFENLYTFKSFCSYNPSSEEESSGFQKDTDHFQLFAILNMIKNQLKLKNNEGKEINY